MSRPPVGTSVRALTAALALLAGAAVASAQTTTTAVTVRLGQSATASAATGSTISVPLSADFAANAGLTLGSLAVRVTWDTTKFALEGIDAGRTGSVVSGAPKGGEQQLSWFDPSGTVSSFTVGTLRFKVLAAGGSAGLTVTVRGAGNQLGQSVLARVRAGAPLIVCIGTAEGEIMGDVNGDARADILDAQQVARWSVGLSVTDSGRVQRLGDVTADGSVDILDAQQLARYDVGLPAAARIGRAAGGSCAASTQSILMLTPGTQTAALESRVVFRVRVVSDAGVPVPGAKLTWEEDGAAPFTQTADADGEAGTQRTAAREGVVRGVVYVGGKDDGGARVSYSYTVIAAGGTPAAFKMDARFVGDAPDMVRTATARAVAKLERVIIDPAAKITVNELNVGECADWLRGTTLTGTVAGIVTYVKVTPIDGAGRTLARAGPCYVVRGTGMPFVAVMEVDSADAASANPLLLENIVLHELLHGVGIGALDAWDLMVRNGTTPDPSFSGAVALLGWQAGGGGSIYAGAVPVEATGGAGTAGAHWRESMLGTELMTGFAGPGNEMPLSGVTLGALRDLGYVVDLSRAESYRAPAPGTTADRLSGTEVPLGFDEVLRPKGELLVNGSLRLLGSSRVIPPVLRQLQPTP